MSIQILCKTASRPGHSSHNLPECKFLLDSDKRRIGRSRLIGDVDVSEYVDDDIDNQNLDTTAIDNSALIDSPSASRVNVIQSPFLNAHYHDYPLRLTLDSGATTNMIKASVAQYINLPLIPASQMARKAECVTSLEVIGEVHCKLSRDSLSFTLDALVVRELDVDILAGTPFLVSNDIAKRPAKRQIVIKGSHIIS